MAFNNEIEEVKAQIKVLEKKLSFLEELEKTKSPVEEAYKDWWGEYPGTENWTSDATRWQGFQAGYNAAYEEMVVEEPEEQVSFVPKEIKELVKEGMKWCEEHPDKDPLDWLKPQTPEQVADGLKEAFREAVKQGVVSSSNKPETLYDVIADWWDEIFMNNNEAAVTIESLVDEISLWLPTEHDTNSYKWNECIRMIREKLR